MLRTVLALFGQLVVAAPAEAQLLKEIKESARQKVVERKARTREHVVQRATEPVDSALERGIRPLDSVVSQAARGVGSTVSGADQYLASVANVLAKTRTPSWWKAASEARTRRTTRAWGSGGRRR